MARTDTPTWADSLLAEVHDGGVEMRAFATAQGYELLVVSSSVTSCTVRAARDPMGYPLEITVAVADVELANLTQHPVYAEDPQRFLAAWATREAAGIVVPDVTGHFDEKRLIAPLGIEPLPLNASAAERDTHDREVMNAIIRYRPQGRVRTHRRGPLIAFVVRPLARARNRRARRSAARRAQARSPGSREPEPPGKPLVEAAA